MADRVASSAEIVRLRALGPVDAPLVERLLDGMSDYTRLVHGVDRLADGAADFLESRPPGTPASAKQASAIVAGEEPVGLVDLIDGYPRDGVAFIGLLAIVEGRRGEGLGRVAFKRVEALCRDRLGAGHMRLAVLGANPARSFWRRLGFIESGEVRVFEGAAARSEVLMMEKTVAPAGF